MDNPQIQQALQRLFFSEKQRIVFWHDPEREFEEGIPQLDGVTLLRLDRMGALEAKIQLERHYPEERFLLYAPFAEPPPEHDWLLDVRLSGPLLPTPWSVWPNGATAAVRAAVTKSYPTG